MEDYIIIQKKYTRNIIAEEIIGLALKNNMVVFGGYVRDRDILGLNKFNDVDIVFFKNIDYINVQSMINGCGFMTKIDYNNLPYGVMSNIIDEVIKMKIIGIKGKEFPESMYVSIDFVSCKHCDIDSWKSKKDTDFSCNLFYKDAMGIHLKYVPDNNIYIGNIDPFTFWKNMTISRKFYPVLGNIDNLNEAQLIKFHIRSTKLVKNGWKMMYLNKSPFTIGIYKNIKIKNRTECSVCISLFKKNDIITNTICKHSFCNECFYNIFLYTKNGCIPSCPNCRSCFSKKKIEDLD
jgi:hypothetical protein